MSISMLHFPFPGIPCAGDHNTPHTTGRLLAVSPDMAEWLAVVTLHETSLGFICLYLNYNMAEDNQFEYLVELRHPR
jgi:hypothetical protein